MVTFNLLHEPWLSVLAFDGQSKKVGLREALVDAEKFRSFMDSDPGVEVSILRLMFAVVQSAVRGPSRSEGMLSEYPAAQIEQYLSTVEGRFDLFSTTAPFFQALHAAQYERRTPMALGFPFLPGSSKIMVASGYADPVDQMEAADAARYLVCAQAWGNGQNTSGPLPGGSNKSTPAGVLAGSLSVYPVGETLAETLLLNVTPSDDLGVPVWEVQSGTAPSGWLGRLAWPARSYLLVPDEEGRVVGVHFSAGHPLDNPEAREPHFVYREKDGVYLRATSKKATWRDLPVIYGWEEGGRSEQFHLASQMLADRDEDVQRCIIYGRDNVGMAVASVQIRMMIPMPVRMLGAETYAQSVLVSLMKQTMAATKAVRGALYDLDPEAASGVWAEAEAAYLRMIEECAVNPDDPERVDAQAAEYRQEIKGVCAAIFEEQAAALPPKVYGQRKSSLSGRLAKAFKETTPKEKS